MIEGPVLFSSSVETDDIDRTRAGVTSRSQACLGLTGTRSDQGFPHAEKPTAHTRWTSSERRSHYNQGCSSRRVSGVLAHFGPLTLGMKQAEALSSLGSQAGTVAQFSSCTVVPFTIADGVHIRGVRNDHVPPRQASSPPSTIWKAVSLVRGQWMSPKGT